MKFFRYIFGCNSLEDCRRIQKGSLALRRLSRWSVLFTLALTLLLNDAISILISKIINKFNEQTSAFNALTNSVFYKWTVGWLQPKIPVPEFPHEAIFLYKSINFAQFVFFLITILIILRWVYADCRVHGGITFSKLIMIAILTNIAVYIPGRFLLAHFLHG